MGEVVSVLRDLVGQLRAQARMDLLLLLTSKGQVAMWAVTDVLAHVGGVAAVLLLAQRFDGIAGWSKAQLVFLVGYATTVSGFQALFFNYNVAAISRRIGRGQLDHTLLQPRPLLVAFLTEGFSPFTSVGVGVPGVLLLAAGARASGIEVTPGFVAAAVGSLAASAVVVVAASIVVGSAAFWAPRGAEEISTRATALVQLTEFPLDPVPPAFRVVLLSAVPAGFVAWFPAGALVGRREFTALLVMPLVAGAAAGAAASVFRKGLRHYARTGSQRYSDFGHRR